MIVYVAILVAILFATCIAWALSNRALRRAWARARAALILRDALIAEGSDAIVVWQAREWEPISFNGGSEIMEQCLSGPDVTALASSIAELSADGRAFALCVRAKDGSVFAARGCPIGAYVALFLCPEESAAVLESPTRTVSGEDSDAARETLDGLATAVAVFESNCRLAYYNRAFLTLWGLSSSWLDANTGYAEILDHLREVGRLPEQQDFAAWKRNQLEPFKGNKPCEDLWHLPGGESLQVARRPRQFGGQVIMFEDVSDRLGLERSFNEAVKVQRATLNAFKESAAVFAPDGRLKLHNAAFARQWMLSDEELADEPHLNRIAEICSLRFGPMLVWEIVMSVISSGIPDNRNEWGNIARSDGTVISLALARLPDGTLMARFIDVTNEFRAAATQARGKKSAAAAPSRKTG